MIWNKVPRPNKAGGNGKLSIVINIVVTLLFALAYYYYYLPAINLHSGDLYSFIGITCVIYLACALLTSGFDVAGTGKDVKAYVNFIKVQAMPVGILLLILIAVGVVGSIISMPMLRAGAYRNLLSVETGDFTTEVAEVNFNQIPMLDDSSAQKLGDRKLGELSDMVSQFEVSTKYTQINYQGRPVRVTYLLYGDWIKWFNNRSEGIPAYIMVDMVTQEASVVRLSEGIKYSPSEHFGRNLMRQLRFNYPTYIFSDPIFEVDDTGHPYWICPKVEKTIGLFGGTDINGAVLMDAVTGECVYYKDVPNWVDRLFPADLIMEQYDYHGTLVNGFINSIFGQRDVTVTTSGYNYIAMNDDVYVYTGVTSVGSDQSNIGFLLCNQRTKEAKYYKCSGATETSAMSSAQGVVQHLAYTATFPLLLNISGEPTYFMALKDNADLVKMYAMVNVRQYQIVSTGTSVAECQRAYLTLLSQNNIITEDNLPETAASGVITEIRSAVIDGNTYFFLRLEDSDIFYSISAADNSIAVILNVGDTVTINHAESSTDTTIISGDSVTLDQKAS
jgi:predicted small secreted protein